MSSKWGNFVYERIDLLILVVCLGLTYFAWDYGIKLSGGVSEIWNYVLATGGIFSFLMYALAFSISSAGKRAGHIAKEMTSDLLKYKKAIESSSSHMIITDVTGKIIYANPAVSDLTGYSNEEVMGQNPRLWGGQMSRDFYQKMWHAIKDEKEVFRGEITNKKKNGELYVAMAVISPILDEFGELVGFVGSEYDITDRKKNEDELRRINDLMVDRELRMVELKMKIASFNKENGE